MKKLGLISICTITGLYLLLAVILVLIFSIFEIPVAFGLLISLVLIVIQFLIGPFITDITMKLFYKVDFNYETPDYLRTFIEDTCKEHNMKYPKLGFINDGAPNVFTYGRVKNDARIILSKGIFDLLDEEEIKAVVAHEIGHATHYDMLLMTVVQMIPLIFLGAANALIRSSSNPKKTTSNSSSKSDSEGIIVLIGLICMLIYIISEYIVLWLSRSREYYADEFSARTTKNPAALSSALVKIGFGLTTAKVDKNKKHFVGDNTTLGISDKSSSQAITASACSFNGEANKVSIKKAMRWDLFNTWAKWYELNATHPLVSKRILELAKYSKEFNQEPYIDFTEKKEKSYVPQFALEVFLCVIPTILFIAAIVLFFIVIAVNPNTPLYIIPSALAVLGMLVSFIKFFYRHPKNFSDETVESLMERIEVSDMKAIPCKLKGELIGRGDPGCIFNEDFVILDDTGLVLLNYKQPLKFWDKLFALFGTKKHIGNEVEITGWFRRNPVPYIDMLEFKSSGKTKKLYSYITGLIVRCIFGVIFLVLLILAAMALL